MISTIRNTLKKCCQPNHGGMPTGAPSGSSYSPGYAVRNSCIGSRLSSQRTASTAIAAANSSAPPPMTTAPAHCSRVNGPMRSGSGASRPAGQPLPLEARAAAPGNTVRVNGSGTETSTVATPDAAVAAAAACARLPDRRRAAGPAGGRSAAAGGARRRARRRTARRALPRRRRGGTVAAQRPGRGRSLPAATARRPECAAGRGGADGRRTPMPPHPTADARRHGRGRGHRDAGVRMPRPAAPTAGAGERHSGGAAARSRMRPSQARPPRARGRMPRAARAHRPERAEVRGGSRARRPQPRPTPVRRGVRRRRSRPRRRHCRGGRMPRDRISSVTAARQDDRRRRSPRGRSARRSRRQASGTRTLSSETRTLSAAAGASPAGGHGSPPGRRGRPRRTVRAYVAIRARPSAPRGRRSAAARP